MKKAFKIGLIILVCLTVLAVSYITFATHSHELPMKTGEYYRAIEVTDPEEYWDYTNMTEKDPYILLAIENEGEWIWITVENEPLAIFSEQAYEHNKIWTIKFEDRFYEMDDVFVDIFELPQTQNIMLIGLVSSCWIGFLGYFSIKKIRSK